MGLSVTILGCSGSYAAPGGACSGYLVEGGGAKVWLDAGPGTLANLQRHVDLADVDAMVLTHGHPDHWLEVPVLANALHWYRRIRHFPVYSNQSTYDGARALIDATTFDLAFDWTIVDPDTALAIGEQHWRFAPTQHYVPTLAVRIDAEGRSLVFTADTGPEFSYGALGADINTALSESTFADRSAHIDVEHLSATEAGQLAEAASIDHLLLTHLAPGEDPAQHLADAQDGFSGTVQVVEVGSTYAA